MELSSRKQALLRTIIEEYVDTAKPVGSKFLADAPGFEVSSATIRNEMKELEDMGYITHPHTSAGRIPTDTGYQYYVEHFINPEKGLRSEETALLEDAVSSVDEVEQRIKQIAKGLAELSQEAILVRIGATNFYYTGISNIFRKPEFASNEIVVSISQLIDQLDEAMEQVKPVADVDIMIGSDNPVSPICSTVITGYNSTEVSGVLAMLGPTRMRYQHNYSLLKFAKSLL